MNGSRPTNFFIYVSCIFIFYCKSEGLWVRGKRHGSGEIVYPNHRFFGHFLDDLLVGSGKFQFDFGCEQLGTFKLEQLNLPGETEEDELISITVSKWKCQKLQDITQN